MNTSIGERGKNNNWQFTKRKVQIANEYVKHVMYMNDQRDAVERKHHCLPIQFEKKKI